MQLRVHLCEERRVRAPTREREPHVAHGDADPRADVQQRQTDRGALRLAERGARETEPPKGGEQYLRDGGAGEPQLIRAEGGRAGAIRKEA